MSEDKSKCCRMFLAGPRAMSGSRLLSTWKAALLLLLCTRSFLLWIWLFYILSFEFYQGTALSFCFGFWRVPSIFSAVFLGELFEFLGINWYRWFSVLVLLKTAINSYLHFFITRYLFGRSSPFSQDSPSFECDPYFLGPWQCAKVHDMIHV